MQQGQETADAASVRPVASLHGFQFHSRCQKIDWRKIASVDVDKVAREVDVDSLQKNVVHLTFCDIDNELGGTLVDPNFLKLFKLAQLCMEYLMHSQELLLQSLSDVEDQVADTSRLLEEERKFRLCDQEAIRQLQRENRKRKRIIENQQLEMLKGDKLIATGAPCPYCRKVFLSLPYLQAHVVRRHPDRPAPTEEALLAQWERTATESYPWGNYNQCPHSVHSTQLQKDIQELRSFFQVNTASTETQNMAQLSADLDLKGGMSEGQQPSQEGVSREELVTRLDRLQRNCDLLFVKNASACADGCFHDDGQVTAQASSAAVRCSAADVGMAPWGDRAGLERLSQQLQHQKQEVGRILAQQERLFLKRLDAMSQNLALLSKASTTMEHKLSQIEGPQGAPQFLGPSLHGRMSCTVGARRRSKTVLLNSTLLDRTDFPCPTGSPVRPTWPYSEASRASPLRFPQSTLSVPVPTPTHRILFQGKTLYKPPSYILVHKDLSMHAKNVHSSPFKEENKTKDLPQQFSSDSRQTRKRMKSVIRSTPNLIDAVREEIVDLPSDKVPNKSPNSKTSVTDPAVRGRSRKLTSERRLLAKKNKKFFDVRHRINRQMDCATAQKLMETTADAAWLYQVPSAESFIKPPTFMPVKNDSPQASSIAKGACSSSDEEFTRQEATSGAWLPARAIDSQPRHFLVKGRRHRQGSSRGSAKLSKPHTFSEGEDSPDERQSVGKGFGSTSHEGGEVRSRPPTRITNLVQTIESQLQKRLSKPPLGSVNTIKDVVRVEDVQSLNAGDQRLPVLILPKRVDNMATPSSGAGTRRETSPSQNYSEEDFSLEELS
ncbi:unnamed protein product [Ixodes pacificus]